MKYLFSFFFLTFVTLAQANERFIPLELFTGGEIRKDNVYEALQKMWIKRYNSWW